MSLNRLLYWIHRAGAGDRRPIWFVVAWVAMMVTVGLAAWLFG